MCDVGESAEYVIIKACWISKTKIAEVALHVGSRSSAVGLPSDRC